MALVPRVMVAVDPAGGISVEGKSLSPQQLTEMLRQKGGRTVVTIAGARDTSLQHLMEVMDSCRTAGVTQIGLAARKSGGS